MERKGILLLSVFCLCGVSLHAQKYSVGTNLLQYANFVTFNAEASISIARHWSVDMGARYNPFTFGGEGDEITARQRMFRAGARFWPWHVYSGWWGALRAQYQEYNSGGIKSPETFEGDRYGGSATFGYTYMLNRHLNLEFGLGFWAGIDKYTSYECPVCGLTTGYGEKAFIRPDDIIVALTIIF